MLYSGLRWCPAFRRLFRPAPAKTGTPTKTAADRHSRKDPAMRAGRLLAAASVPLIGALTLLHADGPPAPAAGPAVDFNRDIRPILSENCFACHGPDEKQRKAKFRLDTKAGAFAELRDGGHALVPGKSSESVLVERITAPDATKRMPPAKFGKQLKPDQIALLTRWLEQGAKWSEHWAFVPPSRPALPRVSAPAWPRNPIDHFILARL